MSTKYDALVIWDMMEKHPDMVKTLIDTKDNKGKPLFNASQVNDVLYNCKDTIENHPGRIMAVLNNPEEIALIASNENKGAALWRSVNDPLSSTIEKNPQAFGIQPKNEKDSIKAKSIVSDMMDKHPDMVRALVDAKDNAGKPLFNASEINGVLYNCKDSIENHPDRIMAVLNNPEEISLIASNENKGAALWYYVNNPLSSAIEENQQSFTAQPKNAASKLAELRERLARKTGKNLETKHKYEKKPITLEKLKELFSKKIDGASR